MFLTISDLEAQIEEEMRLTSSEYHNTAWAESLLDGIEPEIIAESAITTALSELAKVHNEATLLELLDEMKSRVETGDFFPMLERH